MTVAQLKYLAVRIEDFSNFVQASHRFRDEPELREYLRNSILLWNVNEYKPADRKIMEWIAKKIMEQFGGVLERSPKPAIMGIQFNRDVMSASADHVLFE